MSSSIKQYYKGGLVMNYIANKSVVLFLGHQSFILLQMNFQISCISVLHFIHKLSQYHLISAIFNSFKPESIYLDLACNFLIRYLPQPPSIYLQTVLIWPKYLSNTCLVSSQLNNDLLYYWTTDCYLLINEYILAQISINPFSTFSISNITFLPMQILLIFSSICSSTTFEISQSCSSGPYKARQDYSLMIISLLKLLSSIQRYSFQRKQYCMTLSRWARYTACSCCSVFYLREAQRY